MSDFNDTAEWLQTRDTIRKEITEGDRTFPIEVKDITENELNELESSTLDEDGNIDPEAEAEVIREAIEQYLIKPDVDVEQIPMSKRSRLWFYMQLTWSGAEDIQAAMAEMEIPGNTR